MPALTGKTLLKGPVADISTMFSLWIGLMFIQFQILGLSFNYFPSDATYGNFSYGLNWLSFDPKVNSTHPSSIINYLTGLIVSTLNVDLTDAPLKSYLRIGIAIQGITVLVSGIWFAWASRMLGLSYLTRAILLLTIFSFPPLLTFASALAYIFPIGILGAPLGLTLLLAIRGHRQALVLGGVGCGLLAANYYPSLFLIPAFVVAMCLQTYKTNGWPHLPESWIQEIKQRRNLIILIGISSIGAQVIWATIYVRAQQWPLVKDLLWVTYKMAPSVAFFIFFSAITLVLVRWDRRFQDFILPTITTFILASFVLLPWYFPYLFGVASSNSVGFLNIFVDLFFMLHELPWLAVFWLFVVLLTYVSLRNRKTNQLGLSESITLPYDLLFIAIMIIPIAIAAAAYMSPGTLPGIGERIFVAAIPAFTAGWVVILAGIPKNRRVYFIFPIILLCLAVDVHWYRNFKNVIETNRLTGTVIDRSIESFFDKYPAGRLICVRNEYSSRYCTTAYAYNRYRTPNSIASLPTRHLFDNRVVYLWHKDDNKTIEYLLRGFDTPYLVIAGDLVNRYQRFFLSKGARVNRLPEFPVHAFLVTNLDW